MSDSESNVPDLATAKRLINTFEGVTNTDEAFAQYWLQENDWDLQRALNSHFAAVCEKAEESVRREMEEQTAYTDQQESSLSIADGLKEGFLTVRPPESLVMVSWNIDGLCPRNLKLRTKGVIKILEEEKADIVFLQEVIPETFAYIEQKLSTYDCIKGNEDLEGYFVATLLRKGRVYRDNVKMVTFPGTTMGRHLLAVSAHCGKVKFDLLNTHLESTKDFSQERKVQLERCFQILQKRPQDHTVIFGGDLNVRDKEVLEVGGIPRNTKDCWEACGRRKEVEFTWDMTRNQNLEFPGKFKPKMRFDRVYLRSVAAGEGSTSCRHFGLIGLKKIAGTQSFPSDHWGVIVYLALNQGYLPPPNDSSTDDNA